MSVGIANAHTTHLRSWRRPAELPLTIDGRRVFAGFWVRLDAGLIDMLVLSPLWILAIWSRRFGIEAVVAVEAVNTLVGGLYFVVFAALLGATPGKLLLGLMITRPDGTAIGWSEAWRRYAVDLALVAAYVSALLWFLQTADVAASAEHGVWAALANGPPWSGGAYDAVLALFALWALANAVVLVVQRRKRAIHDFIGGTVVVRRQLAEPAREEAEARPHIMTAAEVFGPVGAAGGGAVPPPPLSMPVASEGGDTSAEKPKTRRVLLTVGGVLVGVALIALAVPVISALLLPEPGVRLPNEMETYASEYIAEHGLLSVDEELRAYNDSSLFMNGAEAAILTDRRIIYHHAASDTVIMLSDVEEIRHAAGSFWSEDNIEVVPFEGATMKIEIGWGGETFYHALRDALEDIGKGGAEPLLL